MTGPYLANVSWLTPYLAVRNTQASIGFYGDAFEFETRELIDEDGAIMHFKMTYHGQLILMLASEGAFGSTARTPRSADSMVPQSFYLYIDDVDAVHQRSLAAGGKSLTAPCDQFWGDRFAQVEDLDGYRWALTRRIEA
ncbi:MAG: glyoxalase/bleomycin resistance/extradiol dioxygenase family protein [Burkholderia sp.]